MGECGKQISAVKSLRTGRLEKAGHNKYKSWGKKTGGSKEFLRTLLMNVKRTQNSTAEQSKLFKLKPRFNKKVSEQYFR